MSWISVKDKLPETMGRCLCFAPNIPIDISPFSIHAVSYVLGEWYLEGRKLPEYAVSHWQPLPPPPNESEKK
jgi:hypothetical protein